MDMFGSAPRTRLPDDVSDEVRMQAIAAYEALNPLDPFVAQHAFGRVYGRDTFGSGYNPLLERFTLGELLGKGNFGAVFELFVNSDAGKGSGPAPHRRYALKIQRLLTYPDFAQASASSGAAPLTSSWLANNVVDTLFRAASPHSGASPHEQSYANESLMQFVTAQNELAVYTLLAELRHLNVIEVYDWVRANMELAYPPMPFGLYQLMVMQCADGSLESAIAVHLTRNVTSAEAQLEFVSAVLAQCLSALTQLEHSIGLKHSDLHANNVLLVQRNWIDDPSTHIVYQLPTLAGTVAHMRVPLVRTHHAVVKMADFGFARVIYNRSTEQVADWHLERIAPDAHQFTSDWVAAQPLDAGKLVGHVDELLRVSQLACADVPVWQSFVRHAHAYDTPMLLSHPLFAEYYVRDVPALAYNVDPSALFVELPGGTLPLNVVSPHIAHERGSDS